MSDAYIVYTCLKQVMRSRKGKVSISSELLLLIFMT